MAPPRYPSNPNTIKLTFDFDTLDRLKAQARARKVTADRCAYELIQEALGVRVPPPIGEPTAPEPDEHDRAVQRGLDAIRNQKPQGRA